MKGRVSEIPPGRLSMFEDIVYRWYAEFGYRNRQEDAEDEQIDRPQEPVDLTPATPE